MKRVSILTLSILALLLSVPQIVGANQAPAVLPPTTTVAITEMMAGGAGGYDDSLEIQNVSSSTVNVDGWKVVVSNSYTTWEASTTEQTLSGNMAPGETKTWNDLAGSTNYWGTNIFWVETSTGKGWTLILDANGEVVDFVCTGWTATEVATGSITCSTGTYDVSAMWTGDGHPNISETETQSWQRVGSSDTDTNADWKTQYFRLWTGDGHLGGAAVADSYQRIASTDSDSSVDWATQTATNGLTNTGLISTAGVMITEVDGDTATGYDFLEIQNTGFNSVDVTGWTVIISDSYTDWTANSIEQTLIGSLASDEFMSFTDDTSSTTATYWGNNMYWSDLVGSGNLPNWTLVLDETGALVDFYCTEWTAAEMTNAVIETNAFGSYPILSMGNTNHGLTLPFGGGTTPTIPTVSWTTASQSSVAESGTMTLTAELSAVSNSNVTFLIFVDPTSTATSTADYSISPSGISIPAGQLSGSVTITITDDTVVEGDETVIVTMGIPLNATLGTITAHTATITDDDSTTPPTNTQLQTTFVGGNSHAGNYFQVDVAATNGITVTSMTGNFGDVNGFLGGTVEVWARDGVIGSVPGSTGWAQVATAAITVPAGTTWSTPSQQSFATNFSLAAGSHTLFFSYSENLAYTNGTGVGTVVAQDTNLTIYEGYGTGDLQPNGTSGYANADRIWNGTIEYTTGGGTTPTTPTVSWTTSSQTSVSESGTLTVTAELSATSNSDVTFDVGVGANSTASNPADYTLSSTSMQIPAGQLTADLTITIVDDATAESDETIVLSIGAPVNATLGTPNSHTATITDDDSTTPPTGNQVQTTFAGGNGFASNYFQVDVAPASGITVTSMTGNFSAAGTVEVWSRAGVLGTVPGSTGWSQVATSSIAAPGQQSFTTNFSLSAGSHTLFFSNSTNIAYTNGTVLGAIAGQDANLIIYEGHGSADFQPDGTSGYAFTPRIWNGIIEYTVGGGGTTTSNITINDMSMAEGNSGISQMDFTVTLSPVATSAVTVDYATSDDTATISNADYVAIPTTTLTFNAGETTKTISVTINGDLITEADETFQVNLSNAVGGSIQDNLGVGTITNDDTTGTNTAPVIPTMTGTNNPAQFQSDGVTEITLAESISDVTAIFKAFVTDGQSNNVKIQVEVRKVDEAFPSTFNANDSLSGESIFAAPYDAVNNPTQPAMEVVISPLGDGDYQWRIRPVDDLGLAGTWVYFGSNSNGTPPTISAAIDFTIDTTGGSGGSSYPAASGTLGTGHISSVQIQDLTGADLLVSDSGDSGYTDFYNTPGLDARLQPGQTYTINVDATNTAAQYVCWAWIDWNGDIDFSDESPLLLMDMTGNGDLFSTTFTVPANAVPGATRLRLRLWDGSLILDGDSAGTFSTGEVEDYKVTIPGAVNPAPVVNGGSSGNCGGSIAGSQNGTLLMSLLGFVAIFLLVGIRREA